MQESSTYQATLEEGRLLAARRWVLMLGRQRFGEPGDTVEAAILAIHNRERLERMVDQLAPPRNWDELLRVP